MAEKTTRNATNERSSHTGTERAQSNQEAFEQQTRLGANLMEQALETYEQTLKTGLRLQEEAASWWTALLNETASAQSREKASVSFNSIPAAQRRWLEDNMRVLEQNSRRSLDLLKKAGETVTSLSPTEAQSRLQELWENSLLLLRSNTEAMSAANGRLIEAWMEFMRRNTDLAANDRVGK
jgi:hypothetical protein